VVVVAAVRQVVAAQGFALSREQRQVLDQLVGEGRAIESVEGPPGTGKTTLMRAARVAWETGGHRVAGAATAAKAAQELAAQSGIASRTVEQWVWAIEHAGGLASVDKLVLDEANLTDDRDRLALYREAARTGTEIVEVHDPQQLRTPGCGSMAGYIHAYLEGARLIDNRRQRNEDERAALALYREGRHHEALTRWHDLGQVIATRESADGVAAMVAEWLRRAEGAPDAHTRAEGLLMVAATNDMVDRLNTAVQAIRDEEAQLGEGRDFAMPGGRSLRFHVGDQVLVRRNDRTQQAVAGEAVLNGYQGVVTDITAGGVGVAWRQPGDHAGQDLHTAVCSPAYIADGGLELGYCLTAHKAEGATIGAAWTRPDGSRNEGSVLVWAPGLDRAGLYVAASRDRGQALIYGALDVLEGEREQLLYGAPRDQAEITDRAIAALAAHADATADNPNDRPVLADLDRVLADPATLCAERAERDEEVEQGETPRVEQENAASWPEPAVALARADEDDLDREVDDRNLEQQLDLAGAEASGLSPHAVPGRGRDDERSPAPIRADPTSQPDPTVDVDEADGAETSVGVSAEQRERWVQLSDRLLWARLDDDPAVAAAAEAEHVAYVAELGPRRVAQLRQDDADELAGTLDRWRREAAGEQDAAADAGIGPSVEPAGADDFRSVTDDAIERARQTLREIAAARADEQARAEEERREQLNRWYEQDREAEQERERDDGEAFGIDY
jgi:hypothetical protein